jgi:hypothetical protein
MADVDYGYGDSEDYGYGDSNPDEYGYGDSTPDEYGYGDAEPSQVAEPVDRRPKRRCSVTKFNLDDDSALTAADRIRDLRNQTDENETPCPEPEDMSSDEVSTEDGEVTELESTSSTNKKESKKKSALSRLRKRLSVAF